MRGYVEIAELGVITRVPDPDAGESGNLAVALPLWIDLGIGAETRILPLFDATKLLDPADVQVDKRRVLGFWLALRAPVFELGEILVLDGSGREVSGRGRKPSKWDVRVETFPLSTAGIVAAVGRSLEVTLAAREQSAARPSEPTTATVSDADPDAT